MDIEIYNVEKDGDRYSHELSLIFKKDPMKMSYAVEKLGNKQYLNNEAYQEILLVLADYLAEHYDIYHIEIYNAEKDDDRYSHEFTLDLPPRITMGYAVVKIWNKQYLNNKTYQKVLGVLADYLTKHCNDLKQVK